MKTTLMLAGVLLIAGSAHAQQAGNGTVLNATPGINSSNGLGESGVSTQGGPGGSSAPNTAGTNPGEYVPSTFASYGDAVSDAKANANKKSMSLADLARQAQAEKKAAPAKDGVVLDKDAEGKLVIAKPKKD
jgi:hypothetical protein